MTKASLGVPQCGSEDHVQHNRNIAMHMWLFGMLLALWLPALARGLSPESDLILEPTKPSSPEATLGSSLSTLHEISSTPEINNENKNSGYTTSLNSAGISSNSELSETKFVDKSTGDKNAYMAGFGKLRSNWTLSKCCPRGQYYNNTCKQLPENTNLSVPWSWIEPSQRQSISLENLSESQDVFYGRKSCRRSMSVVLPFHANENMTIRQHQDGVRLSVPVEVNESEEYVMHEFSQDNFCLETNWKEQHIAILCPCEELTCNRKCCQLGYKLDPLTWKCVMVDQDDYWFPNFEKDWKNDQKFYTLIGKQSCGEHENLFSYEEMGLVILNNGSLKSDATGEVYKFGSYCSDYTVSDKEVLLLCMHAPTANEKTVSIILGVLMIIGSLALLLTVCISCALPDTRKRLHGQMALMHNVMLLVAYLSIGSVRLFTAWYSMSMRASKVASFVIQFSFLSAFFWLNVMCIDIALVFKGWRPVQGTAMQLDEKKFLYYSAYAWGSVCIISAATAIAEFVPGARPRPGFGEEGEYFFSNNYAMLLFFFGPVTVLLVANVVLFIFTAIRIKMAEQDSRVILDAMDSRTTRRNKFRLAVYAKLSTLMGITWVFEVLSWAIGGDPIIWFLLDVSNLLRAVFIFIIFCCNKHVYKQLKIRLQNSVGSGSSRVGVDTGVPSTASRSTTLESGNGKRALENGRDSASGSCGRDGRSEKPSTCNLKDFVRPSCQKVIGSQPQNIKDIQL